MGNFDNFRSRFWAAEEILPLFSRKEVGKENPEGGPKIEARWKKAEQGKDRLKGKNQA